MFDQMAYVSSARAEVSPEDLSEIVAVSCRNNQRDGITGCMIYDQRLFFHVIEGDEEAVQTLYHRIARDARHEGPTRLFERPVEGRSFPESAMRILTEADLGVTGQRALKGLQSFQNSGATYEYDPAMALLADDLLQDMLRAPQ